jgi:hypothetical protein
MIDTLVSPIKFRYFNAVFSVGVHCRIVHFFLKVTVFEIFWRCCWNYNPPVMTWFVSLFTHHKTPLLDRCCAIPFVWCANSNLLIDHKFWVQTQFKELTLSTDPKNWSENFFTVVIFNSNCATSLVSMFYWKFLILIVFLSFNELYIVLTILKPFVS